MPAAVFGGCIHLGSALRDLDKVDRVHGPGHHGRTGMPPTVRTMAKRVGESFAIGLVANSATVAAAGDRHARSSLPSAIAISACSMTFVSGATGVGQAFRLAAAALAGPSVVWRRSAQASSPGGVRSCAFNKTATAHRKEWHWQAAGMVYQWARTTLALGKERERTP